MRYGCCVNMVTRTRNMSGTDIVPVLKSTGFDYAELSLTHLCSMSDIKFDEVRSELSDTGLQLEVCNNFFPPEMRLTGPETDRKAVYSYLDTAFERSRLLGIKVIVFGSGAARMVPEGYPVKNAWDQLADLLSHISDYARDAGITIAIEPLRRKECNIINTYREALELEKMSGSGNIKCLLDYYHLMEENEDISVIRIGKNSLAHVHFSEPAGRVFPENKNKAAYKSFFSNLKNIGYDQRISIEAYSENFSGDAANSMRLLKEIENELNSNH